MKAKYDPGEQAVTEKSNTIWEDFRDDARAGGSGIWYKFYARRELQMEHEQKVLTDKLRKARAEIRKLRQDVKELVEYLPRQKDSAR